MLYSKCSIKSRNVYSACFDDIFFCLKLQVEAVLEDEFASGRVLASISSRPGQCGRSDGYILEGKELEFYLKKIKSKKGNK